MKILITGGRGYLGGRIAEFLSYLGDHDITIGSRSVIKENDGLKSYKFVKINWNSEQELRSVCFGMDVVLHLAGINARDCAIDPIRALEFNGVGTGKLLTAAVDSGVKRFIYFSTAHVYKRSLQGTITEKTITSSLHPYATSQRAGEEMVVAANARKEIEGIVIRLSNSFGVPLNKEANCWMLLVNDLCRQLAMTGEMKLTSSGLERRDFITISDVCRAVHHLLNLSIQPGADNVFNVGGNWTPTIWELACFIRKISLKILGFEPKISRIEPLSSEKIRGLEYSIDKLLETGFVLKNDREEEIIRLIKFCQINFSA